MRTLLLAPPGGFCAGVIRAMEVFFPFPPGLASIQKAGQRTSFSQKP
jgi:hypothetical protein